MTILTNQECPCCGKLMPEWKYYNKTYKKCMVVVMK